MCESSREGGISTALLCDWKFNREREGGRQEGSRGGGERRERGGNERRNAKALSERRCCWNYRGLGQAVDAARPSLQSVGL